MFPICAARKVFPSILFLIFCLLCPFLLFPPLFLAGLYWNKSLVTHTAVFLWVSRANFDTLIMPSQSPSSPSHWLFSLLKLWPLHSGLCSTIAVKASYLSGAALGERTRRSQGSSCGAISAQSLWSVVCFPAKSLLKPAAWTHSCVPYLPQNCALPLTWVPLCVFQSFSTSERRRAVLGAHCSAWQEQKREKGKQMLVTVWGQ